MPFPIISSPLRVFSLSLFSIPPRSAGRVSRCSAIRYHTVIPVTHPPFLRPCIQATDIIRHAHAISRVASVHLINAVLPLVSILIDHKKTCRTPLRVFPHIPFASQHPPPKLALPKVKKKNIPQALKQALLTARPNPSPHPRGAPHPSPTPPSKFRPLKKNHSSIPSKTLKQAPISARPNKRSALEPITATLEPITAYSPSADRSTSIFLRLRSTPPTHQRRPLPSEPPAPPRRAPDATHLTAPRPCAGSGHP